MNGTTTLLRVVETAAEQPFVGNSPGMSEKFEQAKDLYLADLKTRTESKATLESYGRVLNQFSEWLNGYVKTNAPLFGGHSGEVPPTIVTAWKQSLAMRPMQDGTQGMNRNTIRYNLTVLHAFFKWSIEQEIYQNQPVQSGMFPKAEEIKYDLLSKEEIELILSGRLPKYTPKKVASRDKAIVILLAESGIRVSELTALRIGDLDFENNEICVRNGKGGKSRYVPFPPHSCRCMKEYLCGDGRTDKRSNSDEFVFHQTEDKNKPLRRQEASRIVEGYVKRLTGHSGITAHDLRHACASLWDDVGVPLRAIQNALGHANISTTERIYVTILNRHEAAQSILNKTNKETI